MQFVRNKKTGQVSGFEDHATTEEIEYYLKTSDFEFISSDEVEQKTFLKSLEKQQFILCLYDNELYGKFEKILSSNERLRIQYEHSQVLDRNGSLIEQIMKELELEEEQLDEMWEYAQGL